MVMVSSSSSGVSWAAASPAEAAGLVSRESASIASMCAMSTRDSSGLNLLIGWSSNRVPASAQVSGGISRKASARSARPGSTGFRYSTSSRNTFRAVVQIASTSCSLPSSLARLQGALSAM